MRDQAFRLALDVSIMIRVSAILANVAACVNDCYLGANLLARH
jgi:hypothetical protein